MNLETKIDARTEPPRAPLQFDAPGQKPTEDLLCYLQSYARARPDVAALWCFGIGFVLGWKLKPW